MLTVPDNRSEDTAVPLEANETGPEHLCWYNGFLRKTNRNTVGTKPVAHNNTVLAQVLGRCQAKVPGHDFRFKAKLFSLDSTTVDLCLSVFPWAKFRRTKGAVKVHVGLDHAGYLPTFVRVTNGKTSDIKAARALKLPPGSIVAADRAYVDFAWIDSLISKH